MRREKWLKSKKFMKLQKKASVQGVLQTKKRAKEREQKYYETPKLCKNCHSPLSYKEHNDKIFCSHKCAATFNNQQREKKEKNLCLFCKKPMRQNGTQYCSGHRYLHYIQKWKNGELSGLKGKKYITLANYIKKYLFEKYNSKCCKCGWSIKNPFTQKIPLQTHHKDGNYMNNQENNLELLCPNCHSLTDNYGYRNKGNGRKHERFSKKKRGVV